MKLRLTEARIPSLRPDPGKAQQDFFHAPTPAAGLRVGKDGRRTFFALYYSPTTGKRTRVTLGEHASSKGGKVEFAPELALTLRQFESEYAKLKGDLARGIDPNRSGTLETEAPKLIARDDLPADLQSIFPHGVLPGTVGFLLKDYLDRHASLHLTPRSYINYRQTTRAYLSPVYLAPIPSFASMDVRVLLDQIETRAPQSVRGAKNVLSVAFTWGMNKPAYGITSNPCQGIKVTVPKGKRERFLTDTEVETVMAALPRMKDQKAADVYRIILSSLCRPGEAAGIRAEDIISLNGERVWKVADPKNGKDFLVPLYGPIGEVINRRLLAVGGQGPLFWNIPAGKDYPWQLQQANGELRELTALNDIRPHDFRRTARTMVSAIGVRDEVAEALLNHAKESVNGTYNLYTYWTERKEALKLWHAKLASIQAGSEEKAA